jgi:serine-type D-Ala-D-Ala endopeptidase (penicillin-binding protein 7)
MRIAILALALWATPVVATTVTAEAWIVADSDGRIIQSVNGDQVRSIASITKLMTTMIVLDSEQSLTQRLGQHTRRELIQLAMIKSDNRAADQLCQHYPGGRSCLCRGNESQGPQSKYDQLHVLWIQLVWEL